MRITKDQVLEDIKELSDPVTDEEVRQKIIDYVFDLFEQLSAVKESKNNTSSKVSVVVIKDALIEENILVNSPEQAEQLFLEKCREYISNFDEYTTEDIDVLLEQRYEKFGMFNSVCINWPEIQTKEELA